MSHTQAARTSLEDDITFARARGADSLRIMRLALSQALAAIDDSTLRFDASEDLAEQAECVNRAMLRICNDLLPRLRLDTAADAQAALLVVAARETTA
jgi:hypothetical protein